MATPAIRGDWSDVILPRRRATLVGMPASGPVEPSPEGSDPTLISPRSVTVSSSRLSQPGQDIQPVPPSRDARRRITAPIMAAVQGLPDDAEIRAAQGCLDRLDELERFIATLLGFPDWVPVSQPMMVLTKEAQRFRQMAAALLHCDPLDLE